MTREKRRIVRREAESGLWIGEKVQELAKRVTAYTLQLIEVQLGIIQEIEGLSVEELVERYDIKIEGLTGMTRILRRKELHGKAAGTQVGYAVKPRMTENGVRIDAIRGEADGQGGQPDSPPIPS